MTRFVFLLAFLCFAFSSHAQDVMVVLSYEAYDDHKKSLNRCDWLYLQDKITIKENGFIGLVHPNGQNIEIDSAGTYRLDTLFAIAESKSRLHDFYLEGIKKDRIEILKTGFAACPPIPQYPKVLFPFAEKKYMVLSDTIELTWRYALERGELDTALNQEITIVIMNFMGEQLLTRTVQDTILSFDYNQLSTDGRRQVVVKFYATSAKYPNKEEKAIVPLATDKKKQLLSDLRVIGTKTKTAQLTQILYLYQKELNLDALKRCRALIRDYPNDKGIKAWYSLLLNDRFGRGR